MVKKKRIIFVPGKNPKPESNLHLQLISRCLLEGVRQHSSRAANEILDQNAIKLCAWNHDFYGMSSDFSDQLSHIDDLVRRRRASVLDKMRARTWKLTFNKVIYEAGDRFPWLIDLFADKHVKAMLQGTNTYFNDEDNKASNARKALKDVISNDQQTQTLLIGHSMGSIIAYEALYELSQEDRTRKDVNLFLTLGSPLGLRYTQERLLAYSQTDQNLLPSNISQWKNVAARGDLISFDTTLADDFDLMIKAGLIEDIVDFGKGVYNWYKGPDGYNFHSSYSYLMGPIVANIIAEWWNSDNE